MTTRSANLPAVEVVGFMYVDGRMAGRMCAISLVFRSARSSNAGDQARFIRKTADLSLNGMELHTSWPEERATPAPLPRTSHHHRAMETSPSVVRCWCCLSLPHSKLDTAYLDISPHSRTDPPPASKCSPAEDQGGVRDRRWRRPRRGLTRRIHIRPVGAYVSHA